MAPPTFRLTALAILVPLALIRPPTHAADSELGRPLVRTFTRPEHKAHAQFHAPFQSPEGLMYFGNQLAVMEYDGRAWRVLKIPLPFTRALAAGPAGDIYVGDEEQLGVLARPDSGEPRYRSLLDLVPAEAKPFGVVRDVRLWRGDLFFATDKNLLRYREATRSFRAWPLAGEARNRLFVAGDRLILHRQGDALYEFANDELTRLSTAPELAPAGTSFVVAGDNDRLIVGLRDQGLFVRAPDGALTPWPTEADAILRRTTVLTATQLQDRALAIGTVSEGVIILDPAGRLLRHLTRDTGLPHATVFALCEDREGGLWVGTNNAPARVLWRSSATVFDHVSSGISDARATDLKRHRGTFFYLSNDGLYRLAPAADPRVPARFERDPRVDVQTRLSSLLSHPNGGLLLAGGRGLQRLGDGGLELLAPKADGLLGLSASRSEPARIFFAHPKGIGTGVFAADGTWRDEGDIAGIDADCYDVFEDTDGALWAGTTGKGVYRATRAAGPSDWRAANVTRFGPAEGLPEGHGSIFLWDTTLGILFDTAKGIYRFDRATSRFVFYRELTAFDARPLVLNPVARGARGEIWTNGLLRIDLARYTTPPFKTAPLVRGISAEGREIVFPGVGGGLFSEKITDASPESGRKAPPTVNLALRHSHEAMTITWVSGLFRRGESERFQTRLVGFNDTWSASTPRNDSPLRISRAARFASRSAMSIARATPVPRRRSRSASHHRGNAHPWPTPATASSRSAPSRALCAGGFARASASASGSSASWPSARRN
ncbi:MAG: hypothetical protein EXS37_13140 [Opitutus sp.]|nr:hypothetical protein [Opitutus sp.]